MDASAVRMLARWLNPMRVYRAFRAARRRKPTSGMEPDPELQLYAEILGHRHLHYGFFEDTDLEGEEISLADVRDAQRAYAELLLDQLRDHERPVLDCGCGMGGLLELLVEHGYRAVGLTPDPGQLEAANRSSEDVETFGTKFEDLALERHAGRYGAIVCSESMQYLELHPAFEVAGEILAPGGRWIVCDYFRKHGRTHEASGHLLEAFHDAVEEHGWSIRKERDLTENVLGTLKYAHAIADQVGRPLVEFALGKLRAKHPLLHHLYRPEAKELEKEIDREMKIIDPAQFRRDKTYRLFVLEQA